MIRTQTAIALVSALMLVLAGCAGGMGSVPSDTTAADDADVGAGDGGGDGAATDGSSAISFYLSDKPSAIDDFEHLNVTITKVGFHRVESAGTDATTTANETATVETPNETSTEPTATERPTATATATTTATATLTAEPEETSEVDDRDDDREHENETDQERDQDRDDDEQDREENDQDREQDGDGEWVTKDVNDTTVDLTKLQGANATELDVLEVAPGTYDKVFIYVGEIEATLKNGEQVRVKLPSERLHVNDQFTVGDGDEIDFVFDVSVFEAGKSGKYILKPIVSQTGTGDEVDIDPVDDEDGAKKGGPGERGNESAESEAGEGNETDGTDGNETAGNETEAGALTADLRGPVKSGATVTLAVSRNGDPVANATVEVDGERVGTTGADGTIEVEIPQDVEELEIAVAKGEAELEIERTIRGGGGDGGN